MSLSLYRSKRDFKKTKEPVGNRRTPGKHLKFVVQKHDASHLHYDFRLEIGGVLKSWAVPKGPSLDPSQKRLAVEVEDHPVGYGDFEGTIPEGEYGGGTVMVWDRGEWIPESEDPARDLKKGGVQFQLKGEKLQGRWKLLRMRPDSSQRPMWLLIKSKDEYSRSQRKEDVLAAKPLSVKSGRDLRGIAENKKLKARSAAKPKTQSRAKIQARSKTPATLTHPDKILYPDSGITKRDLWEYYRKSADLILPHISGRPLMLVRCPSGQGQACFYQKHWTTGMPAGIEKIRVKGESEAYIGVSGIEGLEALAQFGTLEVHAWNSRFEHLENPDQMVFDIDPAPEVSWKEVTNTAFLLREQLQKLHLTAFLKTTGGKGLHVVVPVEPRLSWDLVREFTKAVCERVSAENPGRYLTQMSKAKRKGKIFLDYLRNARGATAVLPYSPRARPGAPVSVPIDWKQLETGITSDHFSITDFKEIAGQKAWKRFFQLHQLPSR